MESMWSSYKGILRDLYLVKDMTRQEVMSKMEADHDFKASAGQYERQFKKWGFRKTLASAEWQLVSRCIQKRKREGKETDLKIDGVPVPPQKLKKAMTRYGQGSAFDKAKERNCSPMPPRGVRFSPAPVRLPKSDPYTLPWSGFSNTVRSLLQVNPDLLSNPLGTLVQQSSPYGQSLACACIPQLGTAFTSFTPIQKLQDISAPDSTFAFFIETNYIQQKPGFQEVHGSGRPNGSPLFNPSANNLSPFVSSYYEHTPPETFLSDPVYNDISQYTTLEFDDDLLEAMINMEFLAVGTMDTFNAGFPKSSVASQTSSGPSSINSNR